MQSWAVGTAVTAAKQWAHQRGKGDLGKTQRGLLQCDQTAPRERGSGDTGETLTPWPLRWREMMKERRDPLLPTTPIPHAFLQPRVRLLPGRGYQRQVSAWWAGHSWERGWLCRELRRALPGPPFTQSDSSTAEHAGTTQLNGNLPTWNN